MARRRGNEEPHPLDVAIGHSIRERRRSQGLSQEALAERLGISFQQLNKYERGANRVAFSRLAETAHALGLRVADLVEGLEPEAGPAKLEARNRLLDTYGAMEMLEAYAALRSDSLRQTVLEFVRGLNRAK